MNDKEYKQSAYIIRMHLPLFVTLLVGTDEQNQIIWLQLMGLTETWDMTNEQQRL